MSTDMTSSNISNITTLSTSTASIASAPMEQEGKLQSFLPLCEEFNGAVSDIMKKAEGKACEDVMKEIFTVALMNEKILNSLVLTERLVGKAQQLSIEPIKKGFSNYVEFLDALTNIAAQVSREISDRVKQKQSVEKEEDILKIFEKNVATLMKTALDHITEQSKSGRREVKTIEQYASVPQEERVKKINDIFKDNCLSHASEMNQIRQKNEEEAQSIIKAREQQNFFNKMNQGVGQNELINILKSLKVHAEAKDFASLEAFTNFIKANKGTISDNIKNSYNSLFKAMRTQSTVTEKVAEKVPPPPPQGLWQRLTSYFVAPKPGFVMKQHERIIEDVTEFAPTEKPNLARSSFLEAVNSLEQNLRDFNRATSDKNFDIFAAVTSLNQLAALVVESENFLVYEKNKPEEIISAKKAIFQLKLASFTKMVEHVAANYKYGSFNTPKLANQLAEFRTKSLQIGPYGSNFNNPFDIGKKSMDELSQLYKSFLAILQDQSAWINQGWSKEYLQAGSILVPNCIDLMDELKRDLQEIEAMEKGSEKLPKAQQQEELKTG